MICIGHISVEDKYSLPDDYSDISTIEEEDAWFAAHPEWEGIIPHTDRELFKTNDCTNIYIPTHENRFSVDNPGYI